MLYQLSYTHHVGSRRAASVYLPGRTVLQRIRGRPRLVRGRSGRRHEQRAAVVGKLADALSDVLAGTVREPLLRLRLVDARVPPLGQLLDGGDVDHPVVQVLVERGHVARDEASVGGDR